MDLLKAWESFYVIVGSSAGALTGLQFVVMALIAEARIKSNHQSIDAFGSPTVVHFCGVMFACAMLCAPWPDLHRVRLALSAGGLAGLAYAAVVLRRTTRQKGYIPVLEDWLWHVAFPTLAYAAALCAALRLESDTGRSLFCVGAAMLLLMAVAIHNTWDTVIYIVVERLPKRRKD